MYMFKESDTFSDLASLALARLSTHGDLTNPATFQASPSHSNAMPPATAVVQHRALEATLAILTSLAHLEEASKAGGSCAVLQEVAAVLRSWGGKPPDDDVLAEVLEDGAVKLWHAARPLLDGVACMKDKEAPLVVTILESVHTVADAVHLDDDVLRCGLD
jgi:hypothetical protein